jgi:sugar lactone lactonase YvrE
VIAANQGIALLGHDGTLTWLAEPEAGGAGRIRMNDGACDPAGRFWAGSMAYDETPGAGALYRYDGERRYTRILDQVTISNGLAWSPDRTRMYYADTAAQTISVLDYDNATGNVAGRRTLATANQRGGGPDGMCIDSEGCLWVAIWGAGEVRRYTPAGEQVAVVTLDAAQPTCPALGGDTGHTLFVTTAREGMAEQLLAAQPDAGRVFATQVDVSGPAVQAWDPAAGPAQL